MFSAGTMRAADKCVLSRLQGQYSWAVIFLSSTSEGHAAGYDSPPVLMLCTEQINQPFFAASLIGRKIIIDLLFIYGFLITTPLSTLPLRGRMFVNVRPCSLITSRLDQDAWVSLMLITSFLALTGRTTTLERWAEDEQPAADETKIVWYGGEQMLSLLPGCLRIEGVCVKSA